MDGKCEIVGKNASDWTVFYCKGVYVLFNQDDDIVTEFDSVLDAISSPLTKNMVWKS